MVIITTTYCSTSDISARLQVPTFTATTTPTATVVADIINKIEDYIDKETNHAWRSVTKTNEYYDYDGTMKLFLSHRTITTFVSGTDKIEIADLVTTGTWTDLVLTANGYNAASTPYDTSKDYYMDYDRGILFFLNANPMPGTRRVRATYRYGESSVHPNIEEACILLTCAKLVEMERHVTTFQTPGGENLLGPDPQIRAWRTEANRLLRQHKEPLEITNTQFTSKRRYWWW